MPVLCRSECARYTVRAGHTNAPHPLHTAFGSSLRTPSAVHHLSQRRQNVECSVATFPRPTLAPLPDTARSGFQTKSRTPVDSAGAVKLGYEMVRGNLVRFSSGSTASTAPTAVLMHGILGSRRNMHSFAKMIVEGFPCWQVLLVDLRCHGESVGPDEEEEIDRFAAPAAAGPHTLDAAADDVLALLRKLKIFPHTLIGHSFGGKVAMSMVKQFGQRMPRPVQVWVLDALPGQVRAGQDNGHDHPGRLIEALRGMPTPLASRNAVVDELADAGFSPHIVRWATTNLKPVAGAANNGRSPQDWRFDLAGIAELYRSYESSSLWSLLQQPPQGLKLDFVKAEGSMFRWGGGDEERILAAGHDVHLLKKAGHWVHTDNPLGLFEILAPSFGKVDLHLQRPQ